MQRKTIQKEILEIKFNGVNIDDVLNMTIDDAIIFFDTHNETRIIKNLNLLKKSVQVTLN